MRLTAHALLVGLAVLLAASTANAYRTDMAAFVGGNPYGGEALNVGDQIEVRVTFDTEGAGNVLLLGLGVLFDETLLTYREDLSSTTSYLFYTNGKSPYLAPSSDCVPACGPNLNNSEQIQINFQSTDLFQGVPGTGVGQLVSLVFDVSSTAQSSTSFSYQVINGALSTIFQLGDGSQPPITLGPDVNITLPEPSVALASLFAIGTVAAVRRRRRA